jgi:hypothetical protein
MMGDSKGLHHQIGNKLGSSSLILVQKNRRKESMGQAGDRLGGCLLRSEAGIRGECAIEDLPEPSEGVQGALVACNIGRYKKKELCLILIEEFYRAIYILIFLSSNKKNS